jgi:hypothetical protein
MTKLIVTPIDMAAPGSYRERQKVLRAYAAIQATEKTADVAGAVSALDTLEALITAHAETDDGSTVSEALETASAADFDRLIVALLGKQETVPNSSGAS